jgi:hypothetical protein
MLYVILLALIAIVYGVVRMKETFVMKYGNPFKEEELLSFDEDGRGKQFFGTTPHTCPCDKPEYDAGLCYPRCEEGYHGVGPVCWADTKGIPIGKVLLLKSCEESGYGGWSDWGLICHEPIRCATGWKFFTEGCRGGRLGAKRLSCDGYDGRFPDQIASLCYQKCPPELPRHVPGMPYLCFRGTRGLSYGRGVGGIPPLVRFGTCNV